jgi:hypothetical protein
MCQWRQLELKQLQLQACKHTGFVGTEEHVQVQQRATYLSCIMECSAAKRAVDSCFWVLPVG